jgi:hypothetical protein
MNRIDITVIIPFNSDLARKETCHTTVQVIDLIGTTAKRLKCLLFWRFYG